MITTPNEIETTGYCPISNNPAKPQRRVLRWLAMAALAGLASHAAAQDVLIAPVGATALNYWGDRTPADAIDGGGMTPNNPVVVESTCSNDAGTMYLSNGIVNTWITFDMGSEQTLNGLRLWNYNEGGYAQRGVKDAQIYVGTSMPPDGSSYESMGASWGTLVDSFTFSQAPGASGCPGADYSFTTPVVGRYIQIYVTSQFAGGDGYTGISEIRFYKPYVPEANMLSFGLPPTMPGAISGNSITLYVPGGTNVTQLGPEFTVSRDATCYKTDPRLAPPPAVVINSGDVLDFTLPQHYWVQSSDGLITNDYVVTATEYSPATAYTWVKTTPAGTYDWESAHWDVPGWPDGAATIVTCLTQAGNNIWNVTSPSITLGELTFGGDGGAAHTLNGADKTLIFDNGLLNAKLSRGEVSTTTGASMTFGAITLNSTLDINITSHITSQLSINAPIGGSGGLNVTNPNGGDLTWPGLVIKGTHTYAGDTTINANSFLTIPSGSSIQSNVVLNGGIISLGLPFTLTSQHAFVGGSITGTGAVYTEGNVSFDDDTNSWQGPLSLKGNFPSPIQFTSIKNIAGGASALGNPQDAAQGTIGCVGGTSTFEYIGAGDSTDRVFIYQGFGDLDWGVTFKASGTTTVESPFKITSSLGGGAPSWLYLGGTGAGEWAGNLGPNANRIKKNDAGTWTLSGTNTYTGETQVNAGTLILAQTGSLRFVVTDTTCSKVTGAGAVVLDGTFVIDTSAVTYTIGGTWTLVNVGTLSETYGPTFTVADFNPEADNVWTRVETLPDSSTRSWVFRAATGVLTLVDPTAKLLSNIKFPGLGYAHPTDDTGLSFALQVKSGTPVNPLSPTYDMSEGASGSPASGTPANFTSPQTYRITAMDSSYQDYGVVVVPYAGYQARVMASNPYGFWPMNEGKGLVAYDNQSLHHGSYNTSGTTYLQEGPEGPSGQPGIKVSGDNIAMRVPNAAELSPSTAFSVELWVKPVTVPQGTTAVASNMRASGNREGWLIYQDGGNFSARLYDGLHGTSFTANLLAPTDTVRWYHLVLTWDDVTQTANFYKDGVLAATAAGITYAGSTHADPMAVGMRSDSNYEWTGTAADLAFYNRALTAEEVEFHATGTSTTLSYADWAATKYPSADLTDPAADLDGDGRSNFEEYAYGLDPTSGTSLNPIIAPLDKGTAKFSYTRTANTGLSYTVWTSTDLQIWNGPVVVTENAGTPVDGVETVQVTLSSPPAGDQLFLRVQAE